MSDNRTALAVRQIRNGVAAILFATMMLSQGSLDPPKLLQPSTDSWPTYNGDYSGRRYSRLSRINDSNINSLSLAWVFRAASGTSFSSTIKSTPLMLNGVMYFTSNYSAHSI